MLQYSTALRNFLLEGGPMKQAFAGGKINLYTGTQPTNADAAVQGTLLATITDSSGAHTPEVQASGSVVLTGGASGSITGITVNGIEILGTAVPFNTTLAQTAQDAVNVINNNPKNTLFVATLTPTSTITLTAKPGLGTEPNTWAVVSTVVTITKTDNDFANGVSSINGLKFGDAAGGVLTKLATQSWSGLGLTDGTAGWFRFVGAVVDAGIADVSETFVRLDGSIATSGGNMNMTNTNIATGAVQTLNSGTVTIPASA